MASFRFHLEPLLEHRRRVEQERQRDLGTQLAEAGRLEEEISRLTRSVRTATQDLRENRLLGRLDLHFLSAHRRYVLATERKAHAIAQEMAQVRRRVDEARAALTEAAQQRKMLEKLREKHQERWRADQARREFAETDDLGMRLAFNAITACDGPAGDMQADDGKDAS